MFTSSVSPFSADAGCTNAAGYFCPAGDNGSKGGNIAEVQFVGKPLAYTKDQDGSSFTCSHARTETMSSEVPSLHAVSVGTNEGLISSDSSPSLASSRRTSPAPWTSTQSSQQILRVTMPACVCGEVAYTEHLRIPVTTAHEGPEHAHKGFNYRPPATDESLDERFETASDSCTIPSKPSPSSSHTWTSAAVSNAATGNPVWVAHQETRAAILEMLDEEIVAAINPSYMQFHSRDCMPDSICITPAMRHMTVSWMSEATYALELSQKVTSMAVNLLDRFLSASRQFPRTMLQLAAASSIFVASKIEGVLPHPRASRVAALSDGAFDRERLASFERTLCHSLGFDLYSPSTQNFLDMWVFTLPSPQDDASSFFSEAVHNVQVHNLSSYILELGSLMYDMLCHRRSTLATAALLLALGDPGLHQGVASTLQMQFEIIQSHAHHLVSNLRHYIGPQNDLDDLSTAITKLLRLYRLSKVPESRQQFVVAKFSSPKFGHIANVANPLAHEDLQALMKMFCTGVVECVC